MLLFHHSWDGSSWLRMGLSLLTWMIESVSWSKYSHCGIVWRDPVVMGGRKLDGLYLLEASYEEFADAEDNELKLG